MNCPVCKTKITPEFDPFCSRLCKNKDLLSWMNEGYRIPTEETPIDENEFIHEIKE